MARTLAIGLTESGTETSVNEDTFSFDQHIYPDMITGGEEKSAGSSDYTQLYVVTQGVGGSGAGDLAGRIFQRASHDMLQHISDYKKPELDFKQYADDLLTLAHARLRGRMARRGKAYGVSFALLLIDANTAYVMNVGETGLLLFRNGRLLQISKPSFSDKSTHEDFFLPYESSVRADSELPLDVLRADIVPKPNTLKRFTLEAGDIILLTSSGFFDNFDLADLARDLSPPDAFAATIRQAQIDSGIRDRRNNRTILAVKVRDLSLVAPQLSSRQRSVTPDLEEPQRAESREYATPPSANQTIKPRLKPEPKASGSSKTQERKPLKTFLLSLLAGFLVGLAIIMVIWYIVIR